MSNKDEVAIEITRTELHEKFRKYMYSTFPKSMRKSSEEAENNFYTRLGLGYEFIDGLFEYDNGEQSID